MMLQIAIVYSTKVINKSRNTIVFLCFRRSIWMSCFISSNKKKKRVTQKWCVINTHWCYTISFKVQVNGSEDAFVCEKKHRIDNWVCLIKHLLPAPIKVQEINVLEAPIRFLTLEMKTKLIPSQCTFIRSVCGMVVHEVLKSKVEIWRFSFSLDIDFI